MLERIAFAPLEAIQLLLLADVKVNFDDQAAVVHQESFKLVYLSIGTFPLGRRSESFYAFNKYTSIPGSIEDRHLTVKRQFTPKSPKVMMSRFFLGRLDDRVNAKGSRVEFLDQTPDCSSFARSVGSFDDNQNVVPALHQRPLKIQKAQLILLQFDPVFFLIDGFVLIQRVQNNSSFVELLVLAHRVLRIFVPIECFPGYQKRQAIANGITGSLRLTYERAVKFNIES